jgi:hypothetical protein
MRVLKRNNGQFIPISAMVMFAMAVFMVAIVSVYKVSRAKLKVQNLADAAALNLATQEAQAYNVITDRNEWMNHMTAGVPSPSDPNAPANVKDCSIFNMGKPNDLLVPPIGCVENTIDPKSKQVFSRRVWTKETGGRGDPRTAKSGAIGYAMLVHTINVAQKLFNQAYNSFLGASGAAASGMNTGPSNFIGLLKADIPALDQPNVHLVAWNDGDISQEQALDMVKQNNSNFVARMKPLKFKIHHDIATRYQTNKSIEATTLGNLLYGKINYGPANQMKGPLYGQPWEDVGWMVPDGNAMPKIPVPGPQGSKGNQVGVGVYVSEEIKFPVIGTVSVGARSKAYVVNGSGEAGENGPIFRPTYWVKLAN